MNAQFEKPEDSPKPRLFDRASVTHASLFDRLRARLLGMNAGVTIGKNVVVKPHVEVRLTDNAKLIIGDHCTIDSYVYIQLTKPEPVVTLGQYVGIGRHSVIAAKKSIVIEDYTQIGPYCQINDQDHGQSRNHLIMNQGAIIAPVHIGRDCWIGSGVRILKGVTIGEGSIIGAGSVVTGNVPPYEIWAGVPAKRIRVRD
jgi:acetyltransferase-like isoleucine patch superfamily enzyme